jgi:type II restriction enzyme
MDLSFAEEGYYESGSQRARAWTESWVRRSVYCPSCGADRLSAFPANVPVADFFCPMCQEQFELKSSKGVFGKRIVDGAFSTMCERLSSDKNPNLFLLNYNESQKIVTNVTIVPKQFFVRDLVEQRKPLGPMARRAGWVGCNIRISDIPSSAKIPVVLSGEVQPKTQVLSQWKRLLFVRSASIDARGWLIEVMKCIETIEQERFSIEDIYKYEDRLRYIYPNNNFIREKIRQQLQVLRDNGYLEFVSRGRYKLL